METSYFRRSETRPPSARARRDQAVSAAMERVHDENYSVYGVRKLHAALTRVGGVDGLLVARCTVQRLMAAAGLRGLSRAKSPQASIHR